jgi:hypothetical protein
MKTDLSEGRMLATGSREHVVGISEFLNRDNPGFRGTIKGGQVQNFSVLILFTKQFSKIQTLDCVISMLVYEKLDPLSPSCQVLKKYFHFHVRELPNTGTPHNFYLNFFRVHVLLLSCFIYFLLYPFFLSISHFLFNYMLPHRVAAGSYLKSHLLFLSWQRL